MSDSGADKIELIIDSTKVESNQSGSSSSSPSRETTRDIKGEREKKLTKREKEKENAALMRAEREQRKDSLSVFNQQRSEEQRLFKEQREQRQVQRDLINDLFGGLGKSRAGYRVNRGIDFVNTVTSGRDLVAAALGKGEQRSSISLDAGQGKPTNYDFLAESNEQKKTKFPIPQIPSNRQVGAAPPIQKPLFDLPLREFTDTSSIGNVKAPPVQTIFPLPKQATAPPVQSKSSNNITVGNDLAHYNPPKRIAAVKAPPVQAVAGTAARAGATAANVGSKVVPAVTAAVGGGGSAVAGGATAAAGGAAGGLAAVGGPIGIGIAAAFIAVGVAVYASVKAFEAIKAVVEKVDSVMQDLTKTIAPYSAVVSGAIAQAEIKQIESMLRRADILGEDVSKYQELRGSINESLADTFTNIMEPLIPIINSGAKVLDDILQTLEGVTSILSTIPGEKIGNVVEAHFDFFVGFASSVIPTLTQGLILAKRSQDKKEDSEDKKFQEEMAKFLGTNRHAGQPLIFNGQATDLSGQSQPVQTLRFNQGNNP